MFVDSEISEYDDTMATNTAVIRSDLPAGLKALLTVLRKLYKQAGGGRRIGSLKRGLPQGKVLESIDDVLRILETEGFISMGSEFVNPIRKQTQRALRIIDAPLLSADPVVTKVLNL